VDRILLLVGYLRVFGTALIKFPDDISKPEGNRNLLSIKQKQNNGN